MSPVFHVSSRKKLNTACTQYYLGLHTTVQVPSGQYEMEHQKNLAEKPTTARSPFCISVNSTKRKTLSLMFPVLSDLKGLKRYIIIFCLFFCANDIQQTAKCSQNVKAWNISCLKTGTSNERKEKWFDKPHVTVTQHETFDLRCSKPDLFWLKGFVAPINEWNTQSFLQPTCHMAHWHVKTHTLESLHLPWTSRPSQWLAMPQRAVIAKNSITAH